MVSFDVLTGLAQVTTAITPTTGVGSLGTTVTASGHIVQITGGTRPGNGTNLFHSFDQFNVGHQDTAQFLNPTLSLPTFNILGRVTGGNPSSIFGTIDTMSYPGANLFLMNPAGIVFGPNAILNVSGSVAFTTANQELLAAVAPSNPWRQHVGIIANARYRQGDRISTGFVESAVNYVVAKRFTKRQQMQWSPKGAHLLLQMRTRVLNGELEQTFREWHPGFRSVGTGNLKQAA